MASRSGWLGITSCRIVSGDLLGLLVLVSPPLPFSDAFQDHLHIGGRIGLSVGPHESGMPIVQQGFSGEAFDFGRNDPGRVQCFPHHGCPVGSVYIWQGSVEDQPESRVEWHTRSIHVPAIIEAVKARHPYDVPGIIATTLTNASPQYAAWIIASTLDKPTA